MAPDAVFVRYDVLIIGSQQFTRKSVLIWRQENRSIGIFVNVAKQLIFVEIS